MIFIEYIIRVLYLLVLQITSHSFEEERGSEDDELDTTILRRFARRADAWTLTRYADLNLTRYVAAPAGRFT